MYDLLGTLCKLSQVITLGVCTDIFQTAEYSIMAEWQRTRRAGQLWINVFRTLPRPHRSGSSSKELKLFLTKILHCVGFLLLDIIICTLERAITFLSSFMKSIEQQNSLSFKIQLNICRSPIARNCLLSSWISQCLNFHWFIAEQSRLLCLCSAVSSTT